MSSPNTIDLKSMVDLKTEEARINYTVANAEYEKAITQSCSYAELVNSAMITRKLMLKLTEKIVGFLTQAIDDKHDETQVHLAMTDCLLDMMRDMANTLDQQAMPLADFSEYFKRGSKPRELMTVSQWADRYRWIESGTNLPGRWKTATAPYLRDIMDDLSEHSPVRDVTFIKSSGVGGTEAMYNFIGYNMHHLQNKDLLIVVPTLELRERSLNPRLSKMMEETPVLNDLISKASRSKANRNDLLEYGARARVIKAGANSPDSLRSDHLPYVICDEVDAFPWDVGGEGDPMTLIENRQRTFSRAKSFFVSTPTNDTASRIEVLYKRSDRRRFYVPCPHCGEFQPLEFGGKDKPYGLKWKLRIDTEGDDIQVESAHYLCKHCQTLIDEGHKTEMLAKGKWVAERPSQKMHHGYHINALYAPSGLGLGWRAIAEKWLKAQNDTAELKAFINTYLGEVFKEQGDEVDGAPLMLRREIYDGEPWLVRTGGVDVQKDRLEIGIEGWGEGFENWKIDYIIIPGDTAKPDVWSELEEVVKGLNLNILLVDSGYNTSMVYEFVKKHSYAVATKGIAGQRALIEDERRRKQRLRVKRKRGVPVEPLGVDQGKAIIYSRLKNTVPGAGYVHFPQDQAFDEEYFAQLTAEKLVQRIKGMRQFYEWVQTRPRNEALDIAVLNLAGILLLNPNFATLKKTPAPDKPVMKKAVIKRVRHH